MRTSIAALLCLIALPASAQTLRQEVYEGTIGKSPIVLEILTFKDGQTTLRSGEYFYSKYRTPIVLSAQGAGLTFTETDPNCYETTCPATATMTLKATGTVLNGTWQAARKPARIPVTLRQTVARDYATTDQPKVGSALPAILLSDEVVAAGGGNPFQQKLYDFDLVNGAETQKGSVAFRTVSHKATGVSYLRLTRHPDPAVLKAVNIRMDQRRYMYQSSAIDCAALGKENGRVSGYGGHEDINIKASYVTPTMMFVEESGSTDCGGAHPNNFWTWTGYDLKTGGLLDMNRLLKLYDTPVGGERSETPQFKALQAKLKPSSPWLVAGADVPDCLAEDLGYGYTLTFNDKGLVFALTDLPHVMGACMGEYYVVPYAELKTLWRPEAKAYFPDRSL